MKQINISVNPAVRADKPMRNILGMNNHPRIYNEGHIELQREWFREMNVRHVRYHDAAIENPGYGLIDISRIFPLFHLDENDPRNYCFDQTDDYFSVITDMDLEIDFRLGETIDHSGFRRRVQAPSDPEKWMRICRNIVAHYRDGKWNGMKLNITRVTVWEEPDNYRLFGGTLEQYAELYCAIYKMFKQEWPDLLLGGPTMCDLGGFDYFDRFLSICEERQVGLDYATVTKYTSGLDVMPETVRTMRTMLDRHGFTETNIVIAEWHLGGGYDADSSHNAAFSASALIRLMDIDYLDAAYYYAWNVSTYAAAALVAYRRIARWPVYFGLKFFNDLTTACEERLAVEWEGDQKIDVLAGKTADGKVRLLVSCFDCEQTEFAVRVEGAVSCTMKSVRSNYDEADATEGKALEVSADGSVSFSQAADGSDVFLLEFEMA